jgi:hypothetical protein
MSNELILFHTAESNIGVFEQAAREAGVERPLRHLMRDDLLKAAEAAGSLTDGVRADCREAMLAAGQGEMVCTCSTIGPAADDLAAGGKDIRRVDRALAEAALKRGRRIAVLFAVATTEGPTRLLFEEVAAEANPDAVIEMIPVPDAWTIFRAGNADGYFKKIAACVDGLEETFDVIALAQASMAPAARQCQREVLTSPGVVFDTI